MISILRIIIPPLAVMGWMLAYPISCFAGLIPLATAVIIYLYIWHVTSVRRKLVADFYFRKRHLIYGFFFSRIRLFLFASVYALVLSAALYLSITLWDPIHIGILTLDALILFILFHWLAEWSERRLAVTKQNAPLVAKQILSALNTVALIGIFTWIAIESSPPHYAVDKESLRAVFEAAAGGTQSQCALIDMAVSLAQQVEGAQYYFLGLSFGAVAAPEVRLVAAIILLLAGGLPALAYSRFVLQLVSGASKQEGPTE